MRDCSADLFVGFPYASVKQLGFDLSKETPNRLVGELESSVAHRLN
jgi:hypothetical protein